MHLQSLLLSSVNRVFYRLAPPRPLKQRTITKNMNFMTFVGLLVVAVTSIIVKVLSDSKLFMLDVSDIHTLGIAEDVANAIKSHVEFSGEFVRVLERVGSDRVMLEYVLACPGRAAPVVAYLTYLGEKSIDNVIRVQHAEGGVCLGYGTQVPDEAIGLWKETTGGRIDWVVEEVARGGGEFRDKRGWLL